MWVLSRNDSDVSVRVNTSRIRELATSPLSLRCSSFVFCTSGEADSDCVAVRRASHVFRLTRRMNLFEDSVARNWTMAKVGKFGCKWTLMEACRWSSSKTLRSMGGESVEV